MRLDCASHQSPLVVSLVPILSLPLLDIFHCVPLQVFWGQEHLTCLNLVEEHLRAYLNTPKRDSAGSCSKGKACKTQPPPSSSPSPSPRTEHSSDDLRTGHFQYLQDTGEPSRQSSPNSSQLFPIQELRMFLC